jgi:hypothetical protein
MYKRYLTVSWNTANVWPNLLFSLPSGRISKTFIEKDTLNVCKKPRCCCQLEVTTGRLQLIADLCVLDGGQCATLLLVHDFVIFHHPLMVWKQIYNQR